MSNLCFAGSELTKSFGDGLRLDSTAEQFIKGHTARGDLDQVLPS